MPLTMIDKNWGEFSLSPSVDLKIINRFVESLNPKIDALNVLINRYNEEKNTQKKQVLLGRIVQERRMIDTGYPDTIVSTCPNYLKQMNRRLVDEIQAERGAQAPSNFTELLKTMSSKQLDEMFSILYDPNYKQSNLAKLGSEVCNIISQYDIENISDGNSLLFKVTRKENKKKVILKLENRMGMPKGAAMHLRDKSMNGHFNPVYAERQVTCTNSRSGNKEPITRTMQVTKFQENIDLDTQGAGIEVDQPMLRAKKAPRIFRQMAERMQGAQDDGLFIYDGKSTNWVDDDDMGELLFHDDKSPVYVNEQGLVDLDSEQNHYYHALRSDYMSSPEMERRKPFSAEKAHLHMLGKNLYQYLTGKDCNAFIVFKKDANGDEMLDNEGYPIEERFIYSAGELEFSDKFFGTPEGQRHKTLIQKMIQPEARVGCTLKEAKDELAAIEVAPLKREIHEALNSIEASPVNQTESRANYIAQRREAMHKTQDMKALKGLRNEVMVMKEKLDCTEMLHKIPVLGVDENYVKAKSKEIKHCKSLKEVKALYKELKGVHTSLLKSVELLDKIEAFKQGEGDSAMNAYLVSQHEVIKQCTSPEAVKALYQELKGVHTSLLKSVELLDKIEAFKQGEGDSAMNAYLALQREAIKQCTSPEAVKALYQALSSVHQSLESSNELKDIQANINKFKTGAGWNYKKKAEKIEQALCNVPVEQRGKIFHGNTKETEAVLSAMKWDRKVDMGKGGAQTFLDFKKKYEAQAKTTGAEPIKATQRKKTQQRRPKPPTVQSPKV